MAERGFEHFLSEEDYQKEAKKPGHFKQDSTLEFIYTPETVEDEFFAETETSPLTQVCERFRSAGVPEDDIRLYRQAVRAYFERPTHASVAAAKQREIGEKESFGSVLRHERQRHYFGPTIEMSQRWPSLLPSSFLSSLPIRGKLTKVSELEYREANAAEVLPHFGLKPDKEKTDLSPEERFLVQLNRLSFAIHEPLHILQTPAPGDQLDATMAELNVQDAIDPGVARRILKDHHVELHFRHTTDIPYDENTQALEKSVIGIPRQLSEEEWKKKEQLYERWNRNAFLDNHYEAVMDILSEDALKPYLEAKPALLLWSYNVLSTTITALRELRQNLEQGDRVDEEAVSQLAHIMGVVAPIYFSVFDSSEEFAAYLEAKKKEPALLGRCLSGTVYQTKPFTRLDIENIKLDCEAMQAARKPASSRGSWAKATPWEYPISKERHYSKEWGYAPDDYHLEEPLTDEGVHLASLLVSRAAEQKWNFDTLRELIDAIGRELQPHKSETGNTLGIGALRERIEKELGLALTEDEVREMRGVDSHFDVKLFDSIYVRRLALRKTLIHALEKSAPEQVQPYFRAVFFRYKAQETQLLTMMGITAKEVTFSDYRGNSGRKVLSRPWNEIKGDRAFGVFGLDVPSLSSEKMDELKNFYDRVVRKEVDRAGIENFIQKMADWKREVS